MRDGTLLVLADSIPGLGYATVYFSDIAPTNDTLTATINVAERPAREHQRDGLLAVVVQTALEGRSRRRPPATTSAFSIVTSSALTTVALKE